MTNRNYCKVINTRLGERITSLLFINGYILFYRFINSDRNSYIYIYLKTHVMTNPLYQLDLISTPTHNIYWTFKHLCYKCSSYRGMNSYILSTSKGVITSTMSLQYHIGGKILFKIN